ncbi:MAG: hypothetical protein SCK57_03505 [Bacillota bacterium]|nr:hypothetical protein [Bacillota bacterium]
MTGILLILNDIRNNWHLGEAYIKMIAEDEKEVIGLLANVE